MTPLDVELGLAPLSLELLDQALDRPLRVTLSPAGLARVARGREWVERLVSRGEAIYGINTGFGNLKSVRISPDQLDALQENLIVSHAVGVGPPAPREIVRWMLLFKTHQMLAGHSGVRPELIHTFANWLSEDILPVVPTRGSLGASGDLAPLAHMCLPLLGRGEMTVGDLGERDSMRMLGIPPDPTGPDDPIPAAELILRGRVHGLRLAAKEGIALINGTQFMSAYAANIAVRARRLVDLADLICCMSLDGLQGTVRHADPRLHSVRPHPGAQTVAANIRRLMEKSEIRESHVHCDRVQDPYSLRCVPQVHGAIRDALTHFCDVVTREINSVTDNPILFGDDPHTPDGVDAISGGNFHGEPLALVLDYLAIALTELANISERRVYLLLSGVDGLPILLMKDTGLNSGFMLPQYTAAALLNECKVLSTPASVDSIPTSLGQEDHVSMGATSALKCYEILDRVETVLAIEMMCAAQALDYRAPLKPGAGPRAALAIVREKIAHAERDRQFGEDIRAALGLLRESARLLAAARG